MSLHTVSYEFPIDFPYSNQSGRMHFCHGESKLSELLIGSFYGLIFNLNQNVRYKINDEPFSLLPKRHFCLAYFPSGHWEVTIEKGSHSGVFIEFTLPWIKMMEKAFPIVTTFKQKAMTQSAPVFSEPYPIIAVIFADIRSIPLEHTGLVNRVLQGCKYMAISMNSLRQMELVGEWTKDEIERIREAHNYMVSNLKYHLTVPFLADRANLTKHNFQSGFKKLYGSTVYHYVTNERMKRAIALVRDTNMSLSEIASEVGYKKLNIFYKLFKRWFGRPPGELRKKADENH